MRERIVCPKCEKVFYQEVEEDKTEIVCPLCSHSFMHIANGAVMDDEDETLLVPFKPKSARKEGSSKPPAIGEDPKPGTAFGDYDIIEEIARGATGIVYKARQKNLDRIVALKVLLAGETASEEQIARFHHEAKAVAKLRHPNIVPVYDVGVYKGKHYFAMEYVDGLPLHRAMKQKRLTPNESLEIILKVASAIAAAHEAHIIHRDIKPANIMIDKDNRVQVMDFGLAKQIEADTQYTRSGTTMGTPNYMPVEQAQGDVKNINERSDIYSLGAVLYEMLTGVPPFIAETNLKTILKVINEEPIYPRKRNPFIHRDIETICMKAMDKDSERRYPTVREFIDDIRRFQAGEPILARPASTMYLVSKKIRKYRSIIAASLLAIIMGVALVLAIQFFIASPPVPQKPDNPDEVPFAKRTEKLVSVYYQPFEKDEYEDELAEFFKSAADRQRFLPVRTGVDTRLPKDFRIDLDVEVNQSDGDSARIGYYMYGEYGDALGDDVNYLRGYAFVFYFQNGLLESIEFRRGGSPLGDGWNNLALKPKDGSIQCGVIVENNEVRPVIDGVKLKPYEIGEGDRVQDDLFPGCGLLLYNKGLTFKDEDFKIYEIIPPPDKLLNIAESYYSAGMWSKAEGTYRKFLKEYAAERGKPESEGGIEESYFIKCRLGIARSLARDSGMLDEGAENIKPRLAKGAIKDFRDISRDYYDSSEYRDYARKADIWKAQLILCDDDQADLHKIAGDFADRYGISLIDAGGIIITGLPESKIDAILTRKLNSEYVVNLYEKYAEQLFDRSDHEGYARASLRIALYHQDMGNDESALRCFSRVIKISGEHPELRSYAISAEVALARMERDRGDFHPYYAQMTDILKKYQIWNQAETEIVFQPELASAQLDFALDLVREWGKKREVAYLQDSIINLKECLLCADPSDEPSGRDDDSRYRRWQDISFEARRALVEVLKVKGKDAPEDIDKWTEDFRLDRSMPDLDRARLEFLHGEVRQYFGLYGEARAMYVKVASDFSGMNIVGLEAINRIMENLIIEGYSKNNSPAGIDIEAMRKALAGLGNFDVKGAAEWEGRQNARMKMVLAAALLIIDSGFDGRGGYTDQGNKLFIRIKKLLEKIEKDTTGLTKSSVVSLVCELLSRQGALDSSYVDAYLADARSRDSARERCEMLFWLGIKYLYGGQKEKAHGYFKRALDDDVLLEYWFSRFLVTYFGYPKPKLPPSVLMTTANDFCCR